MACFRTWFKWRFNKVQKTGDVEYFKIEELKTKLRNKEIVVDRLPFIKRYPFEDEGEFRIIFESIKLELTKKDIPITLSCIDRIYLSPWVHESLINHIKKILKAINGCKNIEIYRTTLINNESWKKIGKFAT